jgi:hypothetical protein
MVLNNTYTTRALVLMISASLSGCYPSVGKYWRVTVPTATYLNSLCAGSFGPPAISYYPYHGIYISIWIDGLAIPTLALHIPTGSLVQVNDRVMHVQGLSKTGPFEATLTLRATPGGFRNVGPYKIYGTRVDPYTSPDNFGPLKGGEDRGITLWYEYGANSPIPQDTTGGTLMLPSLTINGQHYEAESLTFTQKTSVGVAPINC